MRPVGPEEIAPPEIYGPLREAHRRAIVAHKRHRRLAVGEKVTVVFEDRETVRYQIQEMVWIERISDPDKIQDEIDTYNELVPGDRELSATLFVEITDAPKIRPELDRLVGIDEHVALRLGEGADAETLPARFDAKQLEEERISAVQYIRFALTPAQVERLADPQVAAAVVIDHPNYPRETALPSELRAALVATLRGESESLLDLPPRSPSQKLLRETPRVRVLQRDAAGRHVVVEPRDPRDGLLEADAAAIAEIFEAVRAAAADLVRAHGACRVEVEAGPDRPARWHLRAQAR